MILAALLLAAAPAQATTVTLACLGGDEPAPDEAGAEPSSADAEPSPVAISLRVRGQRIDSILIDGPPIFSSYDTLQSYTGAPGRDGDIVIREERPLAQGAQWRGRIRRGAILLRRPSTRITLEPEPNSPGYYSGRWGFNAVVDGHVFINGGGSIRCTPAPPNLNG